MSSYFSPTYHQARLRLLQAVHNLVPRHTVMIDSRALPQTGPSGETLALDWIQVGARQPKRAVVLSSGTHGAEGPVGSAVQLACAIELLPQLKLQPTDAVILQHANNPWGYAWGRRVNENNVDLNRNFLAQFNPQLCDAGYQELHDAINPTSIEPEYLSEQTKRIQAHAATHSLRALQQSLTQGQQKFPKGIQFAGHEPQFSHQSLISFVSTHLQQVQDLAWIDFHTGLGESGACELISGFASDSAPYRQAVAIWGEQVRSAASGDSLSAPLEGTLDHGLARALPPHTRFAFVFPEYGTYPLEHVMQTLIKNNWLWQHGDPTNDQGRALTGELRETFSPAAEAWQQQVLDAGLALTRQAFVHHFA
jgi:Protein of unknown function (DUF2817)